MENEIEQIEIGDTLDLHAFHPSDVSAVVREYLKEARAKGFKIIRIIHGKGIGIQRESVRNILSQTDFVEKFGDAQGIYGGRGSTVAFLKV